MHHSNPYIQWAQGECSVANPLVCDGSIPSIDRDSLQPAAVPVSPPRVHSLLETSTTHLTRRDERMLTRIGYRRGEYGWLIYVGRARDPMPEIDAPSEGLQGAIHFARANLCSYLLFDDGPTLPGVRTYW
jgi:hypothetical protein